MDKRFCLHISIKNGSFEFSSNHQYIFFMIISCKQSLCSLLIFSIKDSATLVLESDIGKFNCLNTYSVVSIASNYKIKGRFFSISSNLSATLTGSAINASSSSTFLLYQAFLASSSDLYIISSSVIGTECATTHSSCLITISSVRIVAFSSIKIVTISLIESTVRCLFDIRFIAFSLVSGDIR